ncbi:hypothetical protein L195_g051803, partial [Trifolium pratense]
YRVAIGHNKKNSTLAANVHEDLLNSPFGNFKV